MDKLQMAHEYLLKLIESQGLHVYQSDIERCFDIADMMQAEADKRNKAEAVITVQDKQRIEQAYSNIVKPPIKERQPDWNESPEWACAYAISEIDKKANWSDIDFKRIQEAPIYEWCNGNEMYLNYERIKSLNNTKKEWQPDWSQSPNADAWRMYSDGNCAWLIDLGDENFKWFGRAPSFNYQGNWQDSLRKRPSNI